MFLRSLPKAYIYDMKNLLTQKIFRDYYRIELVKALKIRKIIP